jgi:hypothetical protein
MSLHRTQRVFSLISGLWVGSFICIGFLVVPILFASLGDRQVAGMVAASLFKTTAYISILCSILLMVLANHLVRYQYFQYSVIRWLLLGMLVCSIGAAFVIIPWMNSLRVQASMLGLSVRESDFFSLFNRLHGASSILFMIQSLLGIALVWRATKNAD